jgi:hypothetical protein
VKPFEVGRLAELVREKMNTRKPAARLAKERVGVILQRCITSIVEDWLVRVKQSRELNHLTLNDSERTGHLPKLVEDLVVRLSKPSSSAKDSDAISSDAALAHGKLRYLQGYTPAMLVHESRILQVTLFGTLESNLSFGLQPAVTRCYDYRGRGRCAVDTKYGRLHESHAEGSCSLVIHCRNTVQSADIRAGARRDALAKRIRAPLLDSPRS